MTRDNGLALVQTKGAMRLMRAYSEISSRATKYALVVLAESLKNKVAIVGAADTEQSHWRPRSIGPQAP